jgi:hypothetical protein
VIVVCVVVVAGSVTLSKLVLVSRIDGKVVSVEDVSAAVEVEFPPESVVASKVELKLLVEVLETSGAVSDVAGVGTTVIVNTAGEDENVGVLDVMLLSMVVLSFPISTSGVRLDAVVAADVTFCASTICLRTSNLDLTCET